MMLVRCTNDVSANAEMMPLVSLTMMQCLPKTGSPKSIAKQTFWGEGETNEAIFKGSARKPLSLAKFVWTRVSDIITAGNIICRRQTTLRERNFHANRPFLPVYCWRVG